MPLVVAPTFEAAAPAIRVVVGDDHSLMRRTLRLLLESEDGLEVVAEAGDLTATIRHVHGTRPDVLILEVSMPDGGSLDAIRRLRPQAPDTAVIVLSMEEDPAYALQAIDAGAIGYVLKDVADTDLPEAIRNAVRGAPFISRRVSALIDAMNASIRGDGLTKREVEVLRLIALGNTSVEIAATLHVSPRTVETHRARISHKLGVTSRSQLVRYALRRGLLATQPTA
jgi:two-component system, NarL family, response regulator NreC